MSWRNYAKILIYISFWPTPEITPKDRLFPGIIWSPPTRTADEIYARLFRRTPGPAPFSLRKSTPAPSKTTRMDISVSAPGNGLPVPSARLMVIVDTPTWLANFACDQPIRARAALNCPVVGTGDCSFWNIMYVLIGTFFEDARFANGFTSILVPSATLVARSEKVH